MSANNAIVIEQYIATLKPIIKRQYDRSINQDLSRQKYQELFKRNVTVTLNQAYQNSLQELPQRLIGLNVTSPQVSALFDELMDEFIQYALQKHRTSCALSNYPDEHNPGQDYISEVLQQVYTDKLRFSSQFEALSA